MSIFSQNRLSNSFKMREPDFYFFFTYFSLYIQMLGKYLLLDLNKCSFHSEGYTNKAK